MNGELLISYKHYLYSFVGQETGTSALHYLDPSPSEYIEKWVNECASTTVKVLKSFEIVFVKTVSTHMQRLKKSFLGCLGRGAMVALRNPDDPCDVRHRRKQKRGILKAL